MMQVIICPLLEKSVNRALEHTSGRQFQWAYLGGDVSKYLTLVQQIGNKGQRIELSEILQETARSLRQTYIDYIGKLSIQNNSISWWVNSLSEKNPFISPVFLYCCYIRACQKILDSKNDESYIVFFIENRAVRRCMAQNLLTSHKYNIFKIDPLSQIIPEFFSDVSKFFVNKKVFLTNSIYRLLLAKHYKLNRIPNKKSQKDKEFFLLYNWIDYRSFDERGNYYDLYFGGLTDHLKNKDKDVLIVSCILGNSYHEIIRKMMHSNKTFLVPDAFLKISDILSVLLKTILNFPRKRAYPLFEDIDISELIFDNLKEDWIQTRTERSSLLYNVVKNWKRAGIPIDTLIYPYENHVWEKAYCIALRDFYPSTYIIGYQHASVRNMLLNYFFSKDELSILPFPDIIITNGKYPEKIFLESNYDSKKVICGGAVRYTHLERAKKAQVEKDRLYRTILVTPSVDKNGAIELIWKVILAFEHSKDYRIIIKFHPDTPYSSLAKDLGALPKNFSISNKPVNELLGESNVLLYTDTTTCIEALSLGIPVIHIGSDFMIDSDPLDFQPDIRPTARTKEEIFQLTKTTIEMAQEELLERRRMWKGIVSTIFGKADENVFNLFIPITQGNIGEANEKKN